MGDLVYRQQKASFQLIKEADRLTSLPVGYSYCELDAEADARTVSARWKHANERDWLFTREKLRCLPSVGVRFGDELVAHEQHDAGGAMNHLYTVEAHRGKGLATAVELKLSLKLIEQENITPVKYVELDNPVGLDWAKRSRYWHPMKDKDGQIAVIEFRAAHKHGIADAEH